MQQLPDESFGATAQATGSNALTRSASAPTSSNRPRHTRQTSFHRRTPSLTTSHQTTDISKHYAVNYQILSAFTSLFTQRKYQVAYAMGLQFVETALLEIPKHGYYYSARHETDRMQSALEAVRVTQLLQEMQRQDDHDIHTNCHTNTETRAHVAKLQKLAMEQVERASHDQYEGHRAETEDCMRQSFTACSMTSPLLACDSLSSMLGFGTATATFPVDTTVDTAIPMAVAEPVYQGAPVKRPSRDFSYSDGDDDSYSISSNSIPGTLPLKRASFMSPSEESALEKALYLSGLEAVMADSVREMEDLDEYPNEEEEDYPKLEPPYEQQQQQQQHQQQQRLQPSPARRTRRDSNSMRLQFQVLARLYAEDFDSLVQSCRIRIGFVDTYQGRLPASTNGCTVIAPVLCMHHLLNDDDMEMLRVSSSSSSSSSGSHNHRLLRADPGLPDVTVKTVIDMETPAILSELRHQLGLSPAAFLIPSDVHDYLIGNGQLASEQFVTVSGGNILDDEHLQSFVDILACKGSDKDKHSKNESKDSNESSNNSNKIDPRRKLAATLFFHEHVVAILKLRRDDDTTWYDVIDSLPSKDTLKRPDESERDFRHRLSSVFSSRSQADDASTSSSTLDDAFIPRTARMRCMNAEALKACLRWYACSKFGEEDVSYIDMYAWDDAQSDFDPRVFQAFVWGDAREVSKITTSGSSTKTLPILNTRTRSDTSKASLNTRSTRSEF